MAVLEDPDLSAGLRALARTQPPQPDRVPAVAARVRRVRRRRVALAGAAAVVVAGVPAALLVRSPAPPPAVVAAATPLAQWPDRSRPEQQELGEAALEAWREESGIPLTRQVRWLYRGPVPVEGRPAYVAVFLAGSGAVQEVVTATSRTDDEGHRSWSVLVRPAATSSRPSGAYLPADEGGTSTGFVLADPAARSLRWAVDPLPGSPGTRAARAGAATSADGVFLVPLPPLDGRVEVRTAGPGLPDAGAQPLGDGDPPLVPAPDPDLPATARRAHVLGGQAEPGGDGGYQGSGLTAETGWPTGALAYASCYGEAPLVVALQGRRTTVPCDGQTHPAGEAGPAERMRLDPRPQGLLTYRVALAQR